LAAKEAGLGSRKESMRRHKILKRLAIERWLLEEG
jgi:hypothetical protein